MRFGRPNLTQDCGLAALGVVFEPMTAMMAGSMALQGVGTAISASSTIAGGDYARSMGLAQQKEYEFEADQAKNNAANEFAAGQRAALDKRRQAQLAISDLTARAGAGGVDATAATPLGVTKGIAGKGEYQALSDLWQGSNEANNSRNRAAGLEFSGKLAALGGEQAAYAARQNAMATLALGGASMLKSYGQMNDPYYRGRSYN